MTFGGQAYGNAPLGSTINYASPITLSVQVISEIVSRTANVVEVIDAQTVESLSRPIINEVGALAEEIHPLIIDLLARIILEYAHTVAEAVRFVLEHL